ncbi:hypothetical protein [Bizionia paragorgiae]|jgi:hypothetical protein|uniref:hypothetical protein n=1 Tax=Bizionia paragorgiae TaxID=283786 RepID=UPI00299F1CB6|nr:hypothetical protein [Bizionia paragorgiae]MDX1272072.1 hypothetical protein [Bizionia paragorgiae]
MKKITLGVMLITTLAFSQQTENTLPYYELPEAATLFTAGTVASRQVDALGFRLYWSTKDLNATDLEHKPTPESRTVHETLAHIYDLSHVVLNATLQQPHIKVNREGMTYEDLRSATLNNLKKASDLLRASDDISKFKIIFGDKEYEFWNAINGPISDAIWHCGQIATSRRVSGNPIDSRVQHFTGTVKK